MGLFAAKCPVDPREQAWTEASMSMFVAELGDDPLRAPVVEPTEEFFPNLDANDIPEVLEQVCEYAAVDPGGLTVELYGDAGADELARAVGLTVRSKSAAGHFRREGGKAIIGIDQTLAATPHRLIATIAHELGHVRLDEAGLAGDRDDHEPLTDLLTVYLGLGIFTANACFDFHQDQRRQSTRRLGYLTEPMFGYGLACYAWLREDRQPDWGRHLDTNPRAYLKRGLRYLADNADAGRFPSHVQ